MILTLFKPVPKELPFPYIINSGSVLNALRVKSWRKSKRVRKKERNVKEWKCSFGGEPRVKLYDSIKIFMYINQTFRMDQLIYLQIPGK